MRVHCPSHITESTIIFTSLMECFDYFDLIISLFICSCRPHQISLYCVEWHSWHSVGLYKSKTYIRLYCMSCSYIFVGAIL